MRAKVSVPKSSRRGPRPGPALELVQVELRDIGCFKKLDLEGLGSWTTVLGDNASGKSTLLRAIALGLCVETDATVLLKDLQGPLRRDGAKTGTIRIALRDRQKNTAFSIETVIAAGSAGEEFVRKKTVPEDFPWERIFVCGYGTGRSRQAVAPSRDAYSPLEALKPLFDDRVDLRNPEVVLLRQENGLRRKLEDRLMRILMLEDQPSRLSYKSAGVLVPGPWGERPFRVLSDGYRSTAQWVLDFCAWAIYAGRLDESSEIGGILLIDEVEQHLHPRWQRHFVQRLRQQFPETQIFTTTHTPLLASGVADLGDAQLVRLELGEDGSVEALPIDPKTLRGKRADQVLTSEAFGLATSRNPGSEGTIDRYTALLGQATLTPEEEAEKDLLAAQLEKELRGGETEAQREVEKLVSEALKSLVTSVKPEMLDLEVKRQLHELFYGDEEG